MKYDPQDFSCYQCWKEVYLFSDNLFRNKPSACDMEALEWVPGGEGLTHGWERGSLARRFPCAPSPSLQPSTACWSLVGSDVPRGGAIWLQEEKRLGGRVDSGPGEGRAWPGCEWRPRSCREVVACRLLIRKRGSWDCWWIGHGVREREESRGVKTSGIFF